MNHELPSNDHRTGREVAEVSAAPRTRPSPRQPVRDAKITFGARRGAFSITREDIENFYHLIDQRIADQHKVEGSCEIGVYYNDAASRRFFSLDQFRSYNETRNRFPTVVTLNFKYHVNFNDIAAPEMQEIDLLIRSSESTSETIDLVLKHDSARLSGDKIQVTTANDKSRAGLITYNINYTRTSWGLDLENHILHHINGLMQPLSWHDRAIRRLSGPLNLVTSVFGGLFLSNLVINMFFSVLYNTDGAQSPEQVLETAAQYLVNGHIAKYIVASVVVSVVVLVLFSSFVSAITGSLLKMRPSFICLSEVDRCRKDHVLKSYNRRWANVGLLFIINFSMILLLAVAEDRFVDWFNSLKFVEWFS